MTTEPEERAKGVVLPPWWLDRVRVLVDERGDSYGKLGVALAKAVGREDAWDHSAVSRFLRDKVTTAPMTEAFVILFGLPRPFFTARTLDESLALMATQLRYDASGTTTEQVARLAVADQLRDAEREAVKDQKRGVTSTDERVGRGRRVGRAARSGT